MRAIGTSTAEITDVICTHLHSEHVGWLFTTAAEPVFPNATVWFGAADPTVIAPGIRTRPAPGHTPGSPYVEVCSAGQRLLLLSDAITCPIQLQEPSWHSFGDVDIANAERTREHLWVELSVSPTRGVGSHFPELQPGRVLDHGQRAWRS